MPDIAFWNKCNNKCVMCTNAPGFARQAGSLYGLRFQIEKMERYLKGLGPIYLKNADKSDFLSLTGGEPALHPDFFRLLAYFRKKMPAAGITLLSNGRKFSDKNFTRRFFKIAAPPFTVGVAVHGGSAAVHDRVAGAKGAFAETIRGLENIFSGIRERRAERPGGRGTAGLEIRIVLHRLNIEWFGKTLAFLLERFPSVDDYRVVALHYEIEGMSLENQESLALSLSGSAGALNAARLLIGRFPDFRIYHFPLCLIAKELRKLCWITLPPEDRVYPGKCAGCRAREKCLGLMLEYYSRFGDKELKRIKNTGG